MLAKLLAHPLTRGLHLDDPATTRRRKAIVGQKKFLRKIYQEWYQQIADGLPAVPGAVLELGSGAGFLREFIPELITSDVFAVEGVDHVLDAADLPFRDGELRAIVMTHVFHHLADVRQFLTEASRCVRPGGRLLLIEPWHTRWSSFVYRWLHHEPFVPDAPAWEFETQGPLSGANGALPWIVFERDRPRFERLFPEWRIREVQPFMPFRYLLSGGVSLRSLMPGWSFGIWNRLEEGLRPWMQQLGMFAFIVVEKS